MNERQKPIKMSDLARIAGVTKSTVSRALAGSERVKKETRDRIQQLARENNYRMDVRAQNLRTQKTRTIGVLLPSDGRANWLASDPFILEVLGAISDALEAQGGHELLLAKHSNNDPSWIDDFARSRSVDGIIVVGQSLYHEQLNRTASWHKTMVVWGAEIPDQEYFTIGSDNRLGGMLATEHLLQQGRHEIAFLGDTRYPETKLRFEGYLDALKKAGNNNIIHLNPSQSDGGTADKDSISQSLLAAKRLDGLFASSDLLAMSAMNALIDQKKYVPSDVAVVGYDNITLSEYSNPPLTTIKQDRSLAGQLLVKNLFELMDTGTTKNAVIDTELVVRASSMGHAKP